MSTVSRSKKLSREEGRILAVTCSFYEEIFVSDSTQGGQGRADSISVLVRDRVPLRET